MKYLLTCGHDTISNRALKIGDPYECMGSFCPKPVHIHAIHEHETGRWVFSSPTRTLRFEIGDIFKFLGLQGQTTDDRFIRVLSITEWGQLYVQAYTLDENSHQFGERNYQIHLTVAERLVEAGIWERGE